MLGMPSIVPEVSTTRAMAVLVASTLIATSQRLQREVLLWLLLLQ
jgi:hypothetical protein